MAVFNWIFLKKSLLATSITSFLSTPIIFINKWGTLGSGLEISDLKKNLKNVSSNFSSKFGIREFSKEVLKSFHTKAILDEVLAKDISYRILNHYPHFSNKLSLHISEELKDHDSNFSSFNSSNTQKFYDSRGGTREASKRIFLSNKAHEAFKEEILKFSKANFTLSHDDAINLGNYVSKFDLENESLREKIKFFPIRDTDYSKDPELQKLKFSFINYSYKQWFQEAKPFFVHMALWKYKENPSKELVEKIWNTTELDSKIGDGSKPYLKSSYAFPTFTLDDSEEISSNSKFKKFWTDKVLNYPTIHKNKHPLHIPLGYTDDTSTQMFVEGSSMYDRLFIKFASAANYSYNRLLNPNKNNYSIYSINPLPSIDLPLTWIIQPTELFRFSKTEDLKKDDKKWRYARTKVYWKQFKPNKANNQTENNIQQHIISDLVTISDSPWIFVRNQAGVHALAVDSHKDKPFEYFNQKILKGLRAKELRLTQQLGPEVNSAFEAFSKYLQNNFNRLLTKYSFSDTTTFPVDGFTSSFKETYLEIDSFHNNRAILEQKLRLRDALLSEYSRSTFRSVTNTNTQSHIFEDAGYKEGLISAVPFDIKTDDDSSVFPELESFYDHDFFNTPANPTPQVDPVNLKSQIDQKIDQLFNSISLSISKEVDNLASDRIFTNNFIINQIIDKFLDNSSFLNELLFTYNLKTSYINSSILGKYKFINPQTLTFSVPDNLKDTSTSTSNFFSSFEGEGKDSELKNIFGKLDDLLENLFLSKFLLEKESQNPWSIGKYSGSIFKDFKDNNTFDSEFPKELKKLAKKAFELNFHWVLGDVRDRYFKFLNALVYLSANEFEKFRSFILSNVDYNSDAFLLFENLELGTSTSIPEKSFKNPFLFPEVSHNDNYKLFENKIKNYKTWLSSQITNPSSQKVDKKYGFKGLFVNSLNSFSSYLVSNDDKSLFTTTAYRYGDTSSEAIKYVKSISSESDLKEFLTKLKSVSKSVSKSDWITALEEDHVYITSSGSSDNLRYLSLQEKKNLIIAALNNYKIEITNKKLSKDNFKKYFLSDPDKSFNLTEPEHTEKKNSDSDYEQKLSKEDYWKFESKEISKDNTSKWKIFPISRRDAESFDSFKSYLNKNLDRELFWTWAIFTASMPEVQQLALVDIGERIEKPKSYDIKLKNNSDSTFIS